MMMSTTTTMMMMMIMMSSGFHIHVGSLPWSGAAYLALLLSRLYLRELCCPLLSAMSSRSLRSQQGLLLVPFARTSTKQSRVFSVVIPSIWNGLPSQLRIFPRALSMDVTSVGLGGLSPPNEAEAPLN